MDAIHFDGNRYSACSSAEISCTNVGNDHTEAVYLGDCRIWNTGTGELPAQVEDTHQVTQSVNSGSLGRKFSKILFVGHSFGSLLGHS